MVVREIFNAEKFLLDLKSKTLALLRHSSSIETIKRFIHCYDILEVTDKINQPWSKHPGFLYGDLGAFTDLGRTCKDIMIAQDPSPTSVHDYGVDVIKLLSFWKKMLDNQSLTNSTTNCKE